MKLQNNYILLEFYFFVLSLCSHQLIDDIMFEAQILSNISHYEETAADQYELIFFGFSNEVVQSTVDVVHRLMVIRLLKDTSGVFATDLVLRLHRN